MPSGMTYPSCECILYRQSIGAVLTKSISEVLKYNITSSAYYIQCDECLQSKTTDPQWWAVWQKEIRAAEKQLRKGAK